MGFKLPNGSDLSEEQLDIINLPLTKDWVITGAPGTGKTVMAIYRAAQAGRISKRKPVLLLVYNNPLMRFLSTAVKGDNYKNVYVLTYHQWISDIYSSYYGTGVPKIDGDHNWDVIAYDIGRLGKLYSHVIVDEAQDFPVELLEILKNVSEHMSCFIDPNQAVEPGKMDTIEAVKTLCVVAPYNLTKNFRNTKPVRDLSALYCVDGEPALTDIPGKKPVAVKCDPGNFDDMNRKMILIINRNKEKNIGVIVNFKALKSTYNVLNNSLYDVNVQMHKSGTEYRIDFNEPGVKIVSYGTMKGLEFDIVLLPLFDKVPMVDGGRVDMNRAYVAVTRPLEELYIFYWSERPSSGKARNMAPLMSNKNLLEWI